MKPFHPRPRLSTILRPVLLLLALGAGAIPLADPALAGKERPPRLAGAIAGAQACMQEFPSRVRVMRALKANGYAYESELAGILRVDVLTRPNAQVTVVLAGRPKLFRCAVIPNNGSEKQTIGMTDAMARKLFSRGMAVVPRSKLKQNPGGWKPLHAVVGRDARGRTWSMVVYETKRFADFLVAAPIFIEELKD